MFEIHSVQELKNFFTFPFITKWNNRHFTHCVFTFRDYCSGSSISDKVIFSNAPNIALTQCTFQQLIPLLADNEIQQLHETFNKVYQDSNLYEHSIHGLEIEYFESNNNSIKVKRYFIIPSVERTNTFPIIHLTQTADKNIQYTTILKNENLKKSILSMQTVCFARCKWSDIDLHINNKSDNNEFVNSITTVAINNYLLNAIGVFSLATTLDSSVHNIFAGYTIFGMEPVFVPSVMSVPSNVYMDGDKKKANINIQISSNTFDGLEYKNYGYLFYKNGFSIHTTQPANILVNKYIDKV